MPVYFIQAGEGGPVKIGIADKPESRLRHLQCGNHIELQIIRVIPGGEAVERWLHRHFHSRHIRSEWFVFAPEMLSIEPPHLVTEREAEPQGDDVRSLIDQFGLSQEELGAKLGVGQTTVSAWVRNNRIPAWRLADLLDLAKEQGVEVSAEEIVRLSRRSYGNRTEGRLMPAVMRARAR